MKSFKREVRKYEGLALRDLVLGGQDGLVNVLGIVLGVATATSSVKMILIAGFSGAVAEAFSMGAVAYTSSMAFEEYIKGPKGKKYHERSIKGFAHPIFDAVIVFLAAFFGAVIPLFPYLYLSFSKANVASLLVSLFALFIAGAITGRVSETEHWVRSGLRVLIVGAIAALLGYVVGLKLQVL